MNFLSLNFFSAGIVIGVITLSATSALSERLSHEWQTDRDYYNRISDDACAGNRNAYQDLLASAIGADLPVAMNDLHWMHAEETCKNGDFVRDMKFAIALQEKSADAGYPLALTGYAHRLMMGDKVPQHTGMAVNFFDRAIHAGYGTAALELAEYYLAGEYIEQDYGLAVHYLRLARRDEGEGDEYPDTDAIASLARRLDEMSAAQAGLEPAQKQSSWSVFDNTASWQWVSDGRLQGKVSVVTDVNTGELFYSFYRESNDPIIHFMGASVAHADGSESELHFGKCGANNCLETFYFDNRVQATDVSIPILPSQRARTLEALKSGDTVTFRYQTRDSQANSKHANFTLRLKGSRTAIEPVERMSAVIANEYNRPAVDYSDADNPNVVGGDEDRSQIFTVDKATTGANEDSIVLSYESAAIIDQAARSAGGKFSKTPVTCYTASQGISIAGIQRKLNTGFERFQQVNAAVIAEPIGQLVLQYVWGGIVFEHVYENRTTEVYSVIEQQDHYTGTTECMPGDSQHASPEAALTGMIARSMAKESRAFDKRTVADWKERIFRPDQ